MDLKIQNKVALITGATSGIGKSTAKILSKEGSQIVITGRREDRLISLVNELSHYTTRVEYIAGDIEDDLFITDLVTYTLKAFGTIDIFVGCAGIALRDKTLDMTNESWDKVMNINLRANVLLSQKIIPYFVQKGGGKLIFVSSTAAKAVNMGASPSYGASKAGLLYFTRHIATEFAAKNIYANAVCPGPVDTEITRTWTPEHREGVMRNLPLGRMGTPEDIAYLIAYLASPLSDYIDGESILINGGRFME